MELAIKSYLNLLSDILENGVAREDRTGVGTLAVFGRQLRFDLAKGFPLVTTKKVHLRSIIHELLWFLQGDTNIKYLHDNKVSIWDEWADENGNLGPIYGKQWRAWLDKSGQVHDQLQTILTEIKENPYSRRLILSAWNVGELTEMKLQPCHILAQFWVHDNKLSLQLYQRSADVFLGVPFNIASYALLTHMVAQVSNLAVGDFVHSFGDVHIYTNHLEQVKLQLTREPYPLPRLNLNPDVKDLFSFTYEDIKIENYQSHPKISAKVAV